MKYCFAGLGEILSMCMKVWLCGAQGKGERRWAKTEIQNIPFKEKPLWSGLSRETTESPSTEILKNQLDPNLGNWL